MGSLVPNVVNLPLHQELTGLTPWEACQKLAGLPRLVFFDSAATSDLGRYSFIAADPSSWLSARGDSVHLNGVMLPGTDPFATLADRLARFRLAPIEDLPPFQGGAAGLLGYDLCHHIERLPRPQNDDFRMPDLALGFYDWVISFDHQRQRAWLVSTGFPHVEPRSRLLHAWQRLEQVQRWLQRPPAELPLHSAAPFPIVSPQYPVPGLERVSSSFDRDSYLAAVRRAIDYIHAGDCFQVNLAQRLLTPASRPSLELYARLRARNPAPFAGYFDLGDYALLSASPERFLRLQDGVVTTRPIKGTRPRSPDPATDALLAGDLRASAKDRAENIMIVDLLRNDLGRVCTYGSVRVDELCRLESYRYVHHLVSAVRGQLRPGCGAVDLLRATFPGGSVTGAPKIRAMEIITELERVARGAYCGSLAYIGFDGTMDANLLIRTIVQGQGWLQFAVGGGIVADSDPEAEYDETWHKAEGLLRALQAED